FNVLRGAGARRRLPRSGALRRGRIPSMFAATSRRRGIRGHSPSLVRIVRLSISGSGVTGVHTEVAPMRERSAGPSRRRPKPEPLEPLSPDEYAGRTDAEEDRACEDRDL